MGGHSHYASNHMVGHTVLCWTWCITQLSPLLEWWGALKSSIILISSIQFSCSVVSNSLQPHGLQHARLLGPSLSPRICSNSCPLSQWCHPTMSSSATPFSFCFNLSQYQGLFQWVSSLHEVAKVLEFQHQSFQLIFRIDFFQDWLVGSPCSLRDSQESSPTPQLKSINSSLLSFLHSPTLTSIHDHWINHSFGYTDLCQQSDVSAF